MLELVARDAAVDQVGPAGADLPHGQAHVADRHLRGGRHRVHHAGLEVDLDPAAAVVRRGRRHELRLLHDGVRQQLVGHPLDFPLGGVGVDQEDPAGADRPDRPAELGDLVTHGLPQRVHTRLAPAGRGPRAHVDAVNHATILATLRAF